MFREHLSARSAAAAAAVLALAGGAAAAGALPDAASDGLTNATEKAGFTVPQSDNEHRADPSNDVESTEVEDGDVEPAADGHGTVVSELARTTEAEGAEKGATIASVASDGRSDARGQSATAAEGGADGGAADAGAANAADHRP